MTNFAKVSSLIFLDNMRCIADLIFGGVCHRFPDLKLVSVESGVGWIPAALETFDWQWRNGGVRDEHPEYDLLPSEYFRRQIYGCFWFEQQGALDAIAQYPDNILFETDYPHPTCQHPGPRTPASGRATTRSDLLGGLPDDVVRKVLHDNAAAVYGLDDRERLDAPELGTPTPRRATSRTVCCTCASTASSERNAFTQDMYRGLKRAAIWADDQPELDAVCLTGTDDWFGVGGDMAGQTERPRGPRRRVGRHRPLPVPPHRALPQAVGGEDQRRCATPAASTSRCTAT